MAELVGDAYIRITGDVSGMRREMSRTMKSAGKDDAGNYVRTFSNEVESIADAKMRNARTALARAMVDPKEFDKLAKGFDSVEDAAESWRLELRKLSREHRIATGDYAKFKNAINEWETASISARTATEKMAQAHAKVHDEVEKVVVAEEKLARNRRKTDHDQIGRLGKFSRWLRTFNIGKWFGKGSRNDFVNLVGSMIGGLGKMVTVPLSFLAKGLDHVFTTFSEGAKNAGESASFLQKAAGGFAALGSSVASAAVNWPMLLLALGGTVAALSAIGAILPGLISLVGLMATAVASLAGAITYGLTAGLLAATPALAGLAAGLGAVGAAFYAFFKDKKNKKFVDDWKKQFTGFGDEFAKPVKQFLTDTSAGFKTLFEDITPSVTAFFSSWKKNMQDASTKKGLNLISDSIGRIATTFNDALPNLLSGLVGFFRPILPYAERLADAIANAFKQFDKWANSKEGQKSIGDFMKEAWKDAKLVWEILKDIGSIIGSVFDFGSEEGTGFLEGIHGWLKKISDYLKDPKNKGKIEEWFANAKQVGTNIGKIVDGIGEIISKLSSKQGQEDAKKFMDTLGTLADHASTLADALTVISATSGIGAAASLFKDVPATDKEPAKPSSWKKMRTWGGDVNDAIMEGFNTAVENVETWGHDMNDAIGRFFTELPGKVSTWFSGVITSLETGFQTGGTTILNGVAGWLNTFATKIEEFDLSAFLTGVLENVATFFVQLGMTISQNFTTIRLAIGQWVTETWTSFTTWGGGVGERVGTGLESIPGTVTLWLAQAKASISKWVTDTLADIQRWATGLPARIQQGILRAGAFLQALPGQVGAWLSSLPERLSRPFREGWDRVNSYFNGAPGRLAAAASRVIGAISGALSGVWSAITSPFRRAWAEVQRILGQIRNIKIPNPFSGVDLTPWNAAGNIYSAPTVVGVGEAGPEAIVPLDRPLSMVNPAVRSLSAIAQGMTGGRGAAGGGNLGPKVNFEAGAFAVNLPTGDPELAAEAVLDRLVAYIG